MRAKVTPALFVLYLLLLLNNSSAQTFQPMRYDESYANLKDSARTLYRHLKYAPILDDRSWYVSFGGGIRWEFDAFNNEDWGLFGAGRDDFFLQRYDFHTDIHLGTRVRVYAEMRSALENGRPHGPRPIDEDKLNLENYFADVRIGKGQNDTLTLRAGRQEMNYGSGRLISVRDGPNLRLYFTGAKLMYVRKNLTIDAFAMEADSVYPGALNNRGSRELNLWGVYSTLNVPVFEHLDFYYIGIRRDNSTFEEGVESEERHTIGFRIWRSGHGLNYDVEAVYQFGRFGVGAIQAWAAFVDIGYQFGNLKWAPQIGIRNDYTSGDRKGGDGNLQSYSPIYPRAGYFSGFDPQVGAANLIDFHPYLAAVPINGFTVNLDAAFDWRYSLGDGVYRPNGVLHLSGTSAEKHYIGTACLVKVGYSINSYVNINFGAQLFNTGPYIDEAVAGAKRAFLTNSQAVFKF